MCQRYRGSEWSPDSICYISQCLSSASASQLVLVACDQNALSEEFCEEPGSYYYATGTIIIIITRFSLRIYSEDRGLLKSKE